MGGEDCAVWKCGCESCACGAIIIIVNVFDVDMCKVDVMKYGHVLQRTPRTLRRSG